MSDLRVIVVGASGRMGRMLVRAVDDARSAVLVGATERAGSPYVGRDAGELAGIETLGIKLVDEIQACGEADVIIDFTAPAATLDHARYAAGKGLAMVIGTTGFESAQLDEIENHSCEFNRGDGSQLFGGRKPCAQPESKRRLRVLG